MMIRRARIEECEALSDLAMRSKAVWGYDAAFLEMCRPELEVTPDKVERSWVAELDDSVAGFYTLGDLDDRRVELDLLFVEPALIGAGVGRALLEHAIATARAGGRAEMIIQSDPGAAGFYRAMGAVQIDSWPSPSTGRVLPVLAITF